MEIYRAGSRPSGKGPADWFTGTVRLDPLFNPAAPDRVQGASVSFEPGARTTGTPIRWARPSSSFPAPAACNAGVARSRFSGPAMSSVSRPARSTGTAPPRKPP